MNTDSAVTEIITALARDYPGLLRTSPLGVGEPLNTVRLDPARTARYEWSGYQIHVQVRMSDSPVPGRPDAAQHFHVRARATLQVAGDLQGAPGRGDAAQQLPSPRSEIAFPAAAALVPDDESDPQFGAAILATVARALDYARVATGAAAERAAEDERMVAWARQRPTDVPLRAWMRRQPADGQD